MQNNNNSTKKIAIKRSKEENSAIMSSLNLQYRTTHPCVSQGMECPFPSDCCFCGLPNDACLFFLIGKCKFDHCKNAHYQNFKDKVLPICQQYSKRDDSTSSSSSSSATTCPCKSQLRECRYGMKCILLGKPKNLCLTYTQNGACQNPNVCKLVHDPNIRKGYAKLANMFSQLENQDSQVASLSRICPNCLSNVEKINGCDHMTYRKCGNEFNWKDMEATQQRKPGAKLNKEIYMHHLKEFQSNSFSFQIFVKGIDGRTISIELKSGFAEKVGSIKHQVYTKTGINPHDQRLQFGSKELREDDSYISNFGIQETSTLHLVSRLPGGDIQL